MDRWTLYGSIDQLLRHNPLYSIFSGPYALAITTAITLFIGALVVLTRRNVFVAAVLLVLTFIVVGGSVSLALRVGDWETPVAFFFLAAVLLGFTSLVAYQSTARWPVRWIQITAGLLAASLAANFATDATAHLYHYGDPAEATWFHINNYLWGVNFLLMVTVIGLCVTAGILSYKNKKHRRPSTNREGQTRFGTSIHTGAQPD